MTRKIIILGIAMAAMLPAKAAEVVFDFYGKDLLVEVDSRLMDMNVNTHAVSYKKINNYINAFEKYGAKTTLAFLKKRADQLLLDDVGYYQLLKVFSMEAFPQQSQDFRKLLVWFGLRNAGYDALLGGANNYLNVFVRLNHETDGGFEMKYRGLKYSSATAGAIPYRELEIYNPELFRDSAAYEIKFEMTQTPLLGNDIETKTRSFLYNDRNFDLNARFNRNLVSYMNDLPRFRVGTHMYNVAPSKDAEISIDDSMQVWLKDLTREQKLAFILALTQKAFPYKADGDYRKREKRNFIEQTLADDYSDCEDKAALFCYLAEKYLKYNTILLYSKNATHVTAAIELDATAPGYNFKIGKTPYLICEGACIGYKPGQSLLSIREIQESEIFY